MKSLAMSTAVIIILGVTVMAVLGFMFIKGFNPGTNQISREQAVAKCQSLCAQDQQKIYQLSGHPGVLDLPNEKNGISFLKPTSFCGQKFNVKGYGDVYCDQLTTCKVTDGDGDSGYLHCTKGLKVISGGGGGGSVVSISGPLAQSTTFKEPILRCDKSGKYIKFYISNNKPTVESKVRVWGIVCENNTPVVNAKVFLSWDNEPLGKIVYYEGFDNLNPNKEVTKFGPWDFSDIFGGNALSMLGYLSPYKFMAYKDMQHGPFSESNELRTLRESFTSPVDADEAQFNVLCGKGPRIQNGKLTLAGQLSGVTFVLSNGTNTEYVHYIFKGSGCQPGKVYSNSGSVDGVVTKSDCNHLAVKAYSKYYPNITASTYMYNNISIPNNNSQNKFILAQGDFYTDNRFEFKHDLGLKNYTLKKVYFELFALGVGGSGGSSYGIDNFKLIRYIDLTKTNQFGMFNTTVYTPKVPGKHTVSASTVDTISASGQVNITATPNIKIDLDTKVNKTSEKITLNGTITYLNGTKVPNSKVWVFVDGNPYPNKINKTTYTFSNNDEKIFYIPPNTENSHYSQTIENGVLKLTGIVSWHSHVKGYLFFKEPQFISNVSMDIELKPYTSNNYYFYVGLMSKNNSNGKELPTQSWYLIKKRDINIPPLPNYNNLQPDKFTKIWFSPLELVKSEDGSIGTMAVYIGGYERDNDNNPTTILIDNLTITTTGVTIAKDGNFNLTLIEPPGTHTITVLTYDENGAEAKKTIDVSIP